MAIRSQPRSVRVWNSRAQSEIDGVARRLCHLSGLELFDGRLSRGDHSEPDFEVLQNGLKTIHHALEPGRTNWTAQLVWNPLSAAIVFSAEGMCMAACAAPSISGLSRAYAGTLLAGLKPRGLP